VPFRRAHETVGALVRRLIAETRDFGSLSAEEWRAASDQFEADIIARVTPRFSVEAKRTPQSTAPRAVAAALETCAAGCLAPLANQTDGCHRERSSANMTRAFRDSFPRHWFL